MVRKYFVNSFLMLRASVGENFVRFFDLMPEFLIVIGPELLKSFFMIGTYLSQCRRRLL